jgi:hypothetical protein
MSWVGWEMGTFQAAWRRRREAQDPRVDPSEESVVGRVVVLCNGETSLGPQSGTKTVRLGIPTTNMSEPPTAEEWQRFRGEARGHTELQDLVRTMERLVENGEYQEWIHDRQKGIDILVTDFKEDAFKALKDRVSHVSKPTKVLVVRFGVAADQNLKTGPARWGQTHFFRSQEWGLRIAEGRSERLSKNERTSYRCRTLRNDMA